MALTFSQADNDGTTPIVAAAALHHDSTVTFLRGLGASMPTDEMELKTVDDVVEFLKTLNMIPDHIPTIEENLRSEDIGAAELFAASNNDAMNELLGLGLLVYEFNEDIYYNIVKRHKIIQEDRAQSSGAAERALEALKNMDKPQARDEMFDKQ